MPPPSPRRRARRRLRRQRTPHRGRRRLRRHLRHRRARTGSTTSSSRLPAGHQTLRFDFTAPSSYGYSYSAGASILYSATPFSWGWDGSYAAVGAGRLLQAEAGLRPRPRRRFAGGSLYLALNFTHGANLAYSIGVPGNALPAQPGGPAAVPLPAGVVAPRNRLAALGARRAAAAPPDGLTTQGAGRFSRKAAMPSLRLRRLPGVGEPRDRRLDHLRVDPRPEAARQPLRRGHRRRRRREIGRDLRLHRRVERRRPPPPG